MAYESLKISSKNCIYRGEGNANLVFRLKVPGEEDKIIRLLKKESSSKKVDSSTVLQQLINTIAMMENVIKPLLGNGIVYCPKIVWLSIEQIQDVSAVVSIHRPLFRCHKTIKEVDTPVLVFPDFCSIPKRILKHIGVGPVISIEIKPKQGFIESGTFMRASDQPMCIFCMRQYYKLKNKSIPRKSEYCPINLFSGCAKKMQHAIRELFKTPQNNFRIFKDQELVYSDEKKVDLNIIFGELFGQCSEEIYILKVGSLLKRLLLRPLDSIACSRDLPETNREGLECANSIADCPYTDSSHLHQLPKNCILERIVKMQSLCAMDIDVIYSFYEKLKQINLLNEEDMIGLQPRYQIPWQIGHENQMPFESELQFMSRKIWEFLLALVFKDCSIMITLKLLEDQFHFPDAVSDISEENMILDDVGNRYFYSIAVIDLDCKKISRIEKIFNTREVIVASYLNAIETNGYLSG